MAVVLEKQFVIDTQDKSIGVIFPLGRGNNGYFNVSYTTLVQNVAGQALRGDTNSGGITFTTSYQNIGGS